MGLRKFERRLEKLVEGAFARAFQSNLRPIELGRRLTREMDDHRTLGVNGKQVSPNHFTITLGPTDHEELAEVRDTLRRQLAEAAREHARDEGYSFLGPVEVDLAVDDGLRTGMFDIDARLKEGPGGAAGSLLLPNGDRIQLGDEPATIGRLPESTVVLSDSNASRSHAEVRRTPDGWAIVDLGSTNGTKVNGSPIKERELADGDQITIGTTVIGFEAS